MQKRLIPACIAALALACSDVQAPVAVPPLTGPASASQGASRAPFIASAISATELHACAFAIDGSLQCWGAINNGLTGNNTLGEIAETPVRVAGPSFAQVSVGGFHTCGLDDAGTAYCWGNNSRGALGTGATANASTPTPVATDLRFTSISTGNHFTCGLAQDGSAHCWGTNVNATLGAVTAERCAINATVSQPCSTSPVPVSGGLTFAALDVGLWNACGLTSSGSAHCWGNNGFGQLGVGAFTPPSASPRAVSGGLSFSSMSVGAAHMCGITSAGDAYCWGYNAYGQLGTGTTAWATSPVPVQTGGVRLTDVVASAGNNIFGHSCGIDAEGLMLCWGANSQQQLGMQAVSQSCGAAGIFVQPCVLTPAAVETTLEFTAVDLGVELTCGITTQKRAVCWGSNAFGGLGNPDVGGSTSVPTPVASWMKPGGGRRAPIAAEGVTILE